MHDPVLLEVPLWLAVVSAAFFSALGAAGALWIASSQRTRR